MKRLAVGSIMFLLMGCYGTRGKVVDLEPVGGLKASWEGSCPIEQFPKGVHALQLSRHQVQTWERILLRLENGQPVERFYQHLDRLEPCVREANQAAFVEYCWENHSSRVLVIEICLGPRGRKIQSLTVQPNGYKLFRQRPGKYFVRSYYKGDKRGVETCFPIELQRNGSESSSLVGGEFAQVFTTHPK